MCVCVCLVCVCVLSVCVLSVCVCLVCLVCVFGTRLIVGRLFSNAGHSRTNLVDHFTCGILALERGASRVLRLCVQVSAGDV